jgi:hypothetical protein
MGDQCWFGLPLLIASKAAAARDLQDSWPDGNIIGVAAKPLALRRPIRTLSQNVIEFEQ